MDNVLVLVRHGESEWNKLNLFTGWKDVDLSEKGVAEAKKAGQLLKAEHLKFDIAYTSALKRAQRTLTLILEELGQTGLETIKDQALNERDYGDLSGLNKDDARKRWGEEQVHIWRRSYDIPPPGGESLKDTAARGGARLGGSPRLWSSGLFVPLPLLDPFVRCYGASNQRDDDDTDYRQFQTLGLGDFHQPVTEIERQ